MMVIPLQANEILSSFDDRLRKYATKQLTKVRLTDCKYAYMPLVCQAHLKSISHAYTLKNLHV